MDGNKTKMRTGTALVCLMSISSDFLFIKIV